VFHARGLVNAKAIQHNLDWVWPYWVERQFNPASRDARFRHVLFRGAISVLGERKKPAAAPRPALPPLPRPEAIGDATTLFLRRILMQAGLNPLLYRTAPLVRRLPACLRALRVESCSAAERLLAAKPALVSKALESLLIGTTELFRDPAVFTQLEYDVLPKLLQRPSPPRIWSAGCSEGAELYSMAMLLAKLGALDGSLLLGSDCRPEAIERAKRAVYLPSERALPLPAGEYWQELSDGRIAISHDLRQAVSWEQSDLLASRSLGTWDLILCRNLAIYLEAAATEVLWMRLADALAPGGFLIVGKAEKPRLPSLRRIAPSIYCKCTRPQTSS
jgi:chemotaxis methyl-accepting protein methylase